MPSNVISSGYNITTSDYSIIITGQKLEQKNRQQQIYNRYRYLIAIVLGIVNSLADLIIKQAFQFQEPFIIIMMEFTNIQNVLKSIEGGEDYCQFKKKLLSVFGSAYEVQFQDGILKKLRLSLAVFISVFHKKQQKEKNEKIESEIQNFLAKLEQNPNIQKLKLNEKENLQLFHNKLISLEESQISSQFCHLHQQIVHNIVSSISQDEYRQYFNEELTLNKQKLDRLSRAFEENICFMDYKQNDKKLPDEFHQNKGSLDDSIYILSMKNRFFILKRKSDYQSCLIKKIQVVEKKKVKLDEIQSIFRKEKTENYRSSIQQENDVESSKKSLIGNKQQSSTSKMNQKRNGYIEDINQFTKPEAIQKSVNSSGIVNTQKQSKIRSSNIKGDMIKENSIVGSINNSENNTEDRVKYKKISGIMLSSKLENADREIDTISNTNPTDYSFDKLITQAHEGENPIRVLSKSSIKNSQIVLSTLDQFGIEELIVACSKCPNKVKEFQCINWNYIYFCKDCVINPFVRTDQIPDWKISKFLKQKNPEVLKYKYFNIQCPECHSINKIERYNPSRKLKKFTCQACQKIICVDHKAVIQDCCCYCPTCKQRTIYIERMKISFCTECNIRFCRKCRTKKKYEFCGCICIDCFEEKQKGKEHDNCQPPCHYCRNRPLKLRQCKCGRLICYGCYYMLLQRWRDRSRLFPCLQNEQ